MITTAPSVNASPLQNVGGWTISHHACIPSTQSLARDLPAWSAVWADEQTAGRGQAERSFVSDTGGLYVTAVLPYSGDALASKGFALAVGWAVCTELCRVGIKGLRLRWPNDLMVGSEKVGGILVDQGGAHTLLVGIGLNITNQPWDADPALNGIAGRLADSFHGRNLPEKDEWLSLLLRAVRLANDVFGHLHLPGLVDMLDRCWDGERDVSLSPVRGIALPATCGRFLGIDSHGAVRLRTAPGVETRIPAHHIQRLREV
ncbi:MAG: biotin--[acetyl-CoA-carboxylase] ligase [Opitutaceae bacterium]|jgi:BirA family biotin operon repressor/biotin-[acetyl-CoA-carboxylase] ligase